MRASLSKMNGLPSRDGNSAQVTAPAFGGNETAKERDQPNLAVTVIIPTQYIADK